MGVKINKSIFTTVSAFFSTKFITVNILMINHSFLWVYNNKRKYDKITRLEIRIRK